MSDQTKVYVKHQSFQNFFSRLNTDVESQKSRVLRLLQGATTDIHKAVVKDLQSGNDADFKITVHIADELSKLSDDNVATYITHRYRYDVYPKNKILDDFPPYLQIEPTSVCNYRCVFCYQTDDSFTTKSNGFMGSMTLDLFKQIVDQSQGKVEFLSLASRGEPLLCRDIDKMLEYSVGKFIGLKMNTNASMLNEAHSHAILAGGISTVVFSADAAVEPLYSQLRVKGNLEKVLTNIKMFQEIKKKHYPQSKIITRVSGVKFGADQDMNSMISLWGELVDQVSFVAYNPWENVYEASDKNLATPCSDLWRRMFVWFDGSVNPCDTDYKSILSPGKVQDHTLSKLWQSNSYQLLRKEHLANNRKNVNPCRKCTVV